MVKAVHPLAKTALKASKNMERMVKVVHPLMAGENTESTIVSYYKRALG